MKPTSGVNNVLTEIKFVVSADVFDNAQDFQVSKMMLYLYTNAADEAVLGLLYFGKFFISRLFMG